MMFESHIAFGMNLLALVAAAALLEFSAKTEACCKSLMKSIAYVALVLAALNLLCTSYYTVKYWEAGYYKTPYGHKCSMMNGKDGMMNMMKDMKGQGGMPNNDTPDPDHEAHHPDQGE